MYPPFYSHPLKVFWTRSKYHRAHVHFRADHRSWKNILGHLFPCLALQLLGNFALLAELDGILLPYSPLQWKTARGPLSTSTVVTWGGLLLFGPERGSPPLFLRVVAVLTLLCASSPLATNALRNGWINCAWRFPFLEVAVLVLSLRKRTAAMRNQGPIPPKYPCSLWAKVLLAALLRLALLSNCPRIDGNVVNLILCSSLFFFLLLTSGNPYHPKITPFHCGLACPFLALLVDQKAYFFFGMGYIASVLQGLVHEISDEPATLPRLSQLDDEVAHVTYFPLLLLHTLWTSLFASNYAIQDKNKVKQ